MSKQLRKIFQGILSICDEVDINGEFIEILNEKREDLADPDSKELFYKELYKALKDANKEEILLKKVFTLSDFSFFAQRVKEKIEGRSPFKGQIMGVTTEDAEILEYGMKKFSELNEESRQILDVFYVFLKNFIQRRSYGKAIGFFENVNLFKIVFYSTLCLLKNNRERLNNLQDLFQSKIFEFYAVYEDFPNKANLQENIFIIAILWTLLEKEMSLNPDRHIELIRRHGRLFPSSPRDLLSKAFSIIEQLESPKIKQYLEILSSFELAYKFFVNLEKMETTKYRNLDEIKKKFAESLIELLKENKEFQNSYLKMVVDFSIFLEKYAEEDYEILVNDLNMEKTGWFEERIVRNFQNDSAIDDTINFLLNKSIKEKWTKRIEEEAVNFLREYIEKNLEELLEEESDLVFELLMELIKRKKKLQLNYIPVGKEIFKRLSEYLLEEGGEDEIIKFLVQKISYLLRKEGARIFVKETIDFIKDNISKIEKNKLEGLIEISKRLKEKLTQSYLEEIGEKLLSNEFDPKACQNFLVLLKHARAFKDTIMLVENIENFKKYSGDKESIKILEEIERILQRKGGYQNEKKQ